MLYKDDYIDSGLAVEKHKNSNFDYTPNLFGDSSVINAYTAYIKSNLKIGLGVEKTLTNTSIVTVGAGLGEDVSAFGVGLAHRF